jgi:hypothetical protein
MFYNVLYLNYNFYNILKIDEDITEKVRVVVLHGLATIDAGGTGPGRAGGACGRGAALQARLEVLLGTVVAAPRQPAYARPPIAGADAVSEARGEAGQEEIAERGGVGDCSGGTAGPSESSGRGLGQGPGPHRDGCAAGPEAARLSAARRLSL